MSQSWGGGSGSGGWGGGPPGGGSGTVPGAPPGAGGYGPPPGAPPGGGGYGPPPGAGGYPPPPGGFGGGFAPPPQGFPPGYTPEAQGGAVPWEDRSQGFFGRWWETVKAVNFKPRPLFAGAAQSDDPWPAITFGVTTGGLMGLVLGAFVAILYVAMGSVMIASLSSLGGAKTSGPPAAVMGAMMAVFGFAAVIIYPLQFMFAAFVGPWISGGVIHGMLALLKGTTRSYMHTVRVVSYSHASQVWMLVPVFGPLVAIVFQIIALMTGLDEAHKCGSGKAIAAVLLPGILFLCCCCGAYALLVGASVSAHR